MNVVMDRSPAGVVDMARFRLRAELIEQQRIAKGLSVEQVTHRANMTRKTYNLLISPRRKTVDLKVLGEACRVLGIRPDQILEEAPDEPAETDASSN